MQEEGGEKGVRHLIPAEVPPPLLLVCSSAALSPDDRWRLLVRRKKEGEFDCCFSAERCQLEMTNFGSEGGGGGCCFLPPPAHSPLQLEIWGKKRREGCAKGK